jgi:hypothetical protein
VLRKDVNGGLCPDNIKKGELEQEIVEYVLIT